MWLVCVCWTGSSVQHREKLLGWDGQWTLSSAGDIVINCRQSLRHYYLCRIPLHGFYSIYVRWTPNLQKQILFFCTYNSNTELLCSLSCTVNETWARMLAELNHNSEALRLARKSYAWHFLNQVLNFATWCLRTFINNRKCFRELI